MYHRETITRAALALAALAALSLCAKTAVDLLLRAGRFPAWFAPLFAVGVAALAVPVAYLALRRPPTEPEVSRRIAVATWILLVSSFWCTSAVHGFAPFRPDVAQIWEGWPSLRLNLALAAGGLVITAALAVLDLAARRRTVAVAILSVGSFVLLLPNDDCANPFNEWWIEACGASPLMFVPNLIAIVIGCAVLRGVRPLAGVLLLAATCLATLLLGLGHRTGLIW